MVARARAGLEPSSFEGLITFICVSGISRKSKLLQRLIGLRGSLWSCPARISAPRFWQSKIQRGAVLKGMPRREGLSGLYGRVLGRSGLNFRGGHDLDREAYLYHQAAF